MRLRSRCILFGSCCLLALALWLIAPRPAAACSPPPVTPWFEPLVEAGSPDLPPGVELRNLTPYSLALTNTSATPLYVIGEEDFGVGHYPPFHIALPHNKGALQRLHDGQRWEWGWDSESQAGQGPNAMAWVRIERSYWTQSSFLEISAWPDGLMAGHRATLDTVPSSYRTGDNRPADVPLPPPQPAALTLVYGDQILTVPVTISHQLYRGYKTDSVATYNGFRGCGDDDALATRGIMRFFAYFRGANPALLALILSIIGALIIAALAWVIRKIVPSAK